MGGRLALDAAWLFAAFLLLVVVLAAALATRRYLLERGGGTVECGLRNPAERGAWRLGVASYEGDELCWYGALDVRFRPEQVLHRRSLTVKSRRPSLAAEASVLGPERVVVELSTGDSDNVELAMTEEALTGFLAWLEASPPGSHLADMALRSMDSEKIDHSPEMFKHAPSGETRWRLSARIADSGSYAGRRCCGPPR